MASLNHDFINYILDHNLNKELFKGQFGLEKENVRVDTKGRLAITPHPDLFGGKMDHPYIQTDFSESQIEMITPVFSSIEETYHFLEALQDIVTQALPNEYLWPSSNPPALPQDEGIPIAKMNDPEEDQYRSELARKYGRKKQLLSGIHYNFSFDEGFLKVLYKASKGQEGFRDFKDRLYMKVARNILKYRWLLIYLTGASPVFNNTYIERCVSLSEKMDEESHFFPNMYSLRNSLCGYRNETPLFVSFDSLEGYVEDLRHLVQSRELLSEKEFYSPVRMKSAKGGNHLQALADHGIAYLELRMFDLNPLFKNGISLQTLQFVHLFLVYMLFVHDEPFNQREQQQANRNVDTLLRDGLQGELSGSNPRINMEEAALGILGSMQRMMEVLQPDNDAWTRILEHEKKCILNTDLSYASIVKSQVHESNFLLYHLEKAKQYAQSSFEAGYKLAGYEDLELSTQLLLKAAIRRGIETEILDREENFVLLRKGNHQEYVKQATKTSLDSYSTVLVMENKIVTKRILKQHGIQVPSGYAYQSIQDAMHDFEVHHGNQIVIKPKSTNYGLGITIFTGHFTIEEYQHAMEIAFSHDRTVLLEEFVAGKEYRFLVMGGEVIGILHRVPANVVGDGKHTIEQLVQEKNKDPLRGKGYKTPLERIQLGEAESMFLKGHSRTPLDIPKPGEVIYLRENSNISTGGDSIDYTDSIPTGYKQIAIDAAKAAGATFCGVDMMIQDIEEEASNWNYSIIELNFNPAIHIHCYPYQGLNRKADDKILDLLFGQKTDMP